jgi:hypothetical protein
VKDFQEGFEINIINLCAYINLNTIHHIDINYKSCENMSLLYANIFKNSEIATNYIKIKVIIIHLYFT